MERIAIFIDGSNFYHGLKEEVNSTSLDFSNFFKILTKDKQLTRIYYYNAPCDQFVEPERYNSQQKFFRALKSIPYLELKLGRLERRVVKLNNELLIKDFGGEIANKIIEKYGANIVTYVEKGVDVQIAVDLIKLAYNNVYDTAILISGDGDFAPAIIAVKELGKHVEVAYFKSRKTYHIKQVCDRFIPLDKNILRPFIKNKKW